VKEQVEIEQVENSKRISGQASGVSMGKTGFLLGPKVAELLLPGIGHLKFGKRDNNSGLDWSVGFSIGVEPS
jgi:hypothetical protein